MNRVSNVWKNSLSIFLSLIIFGLSFSSLYAQNESSQNLQNNTQVLVERVAPGELLPVTVRLLNFGSENRTDVIIIYQILDSNNFIVSEETETVAIETTASFIKNLHLPINITPGTYKINSKILYEDQTTPAVSSFQFEVERKIMGVFLSDLVFYGVIFLSIFLILLYFMRLFYTKNKKYNFTPFDYSDVPEEHRLFYEIISDAVMQMRLHKGDEALRIAQKIQGLVISRSGKVLSLDGDPSIIMASLVSMYQSKLGKSINLSFGSRSGQSKVIVRN